MNGFIEVHYKGKRHLINTRWIEEICEEGEHQAVIFFAFTVPQQIDQDYLKTDETYEQLMTLMEG